jgi:hypothetical protein
MNPTVKNNSTKVENRLNNLVIANGVNLLKETIKSDIISLVQKEKNQKEIIRQAKKAKTQNKKDISEAWKTATKSKSAIKKYIQDNSELMQPLLDNINLINNTTFDVGVFNGTLENFALPFENYKIDFDGNNLEMKNDFRNIDWYLTLLDRKILFSDYSSSEFLEYTKKETDKKCKSMVNNEVKKILTTAKIELNKIQFRGFEKKFKLLNNGIQKNTEYINKCTLLLAEYIY